MCEHCEPLREALAAQTEGNLDRITRRMTEAQEVDPEAALRAAAEAMIAFASATGAFEGVILLGKHGQAFISAASPQEAKRLVTELAQDMDPVVRGWIAGQN